MIDLNKKNRCICQKYNPSLSECIGKYGVSEEGKSIKLLPKNNDEKVATIVIDGCLINDRVTKCDAIFLFQSKTKKVSFLTELKGAGIKDIEKAFHQLSYTRDNRNEYKTIQKKFYELDSKHIKEKFIIVSNGMINKIEQDRFENKYNIKVAQVLHSEATTPIPDLRKYI